MPTEAGSVDPSCSPTGSERTTTNEHTNPISVRIKIFSFPKLPPCAGASSRHLEDWHRDAQSESKPQVSKIMTLVSLLSFFFGVVAPLTRKLSGCNIQDCLPLGFALAATSLYSTAANIVTTNRDRNISLTLAL